jgi:hypothetical protein
MDTPASQGNLGPSFKWKPILVFVLLTSLFQFLLQRPNWPGRCLRYSSTALLGYQCLPFTQKFRKQGKPSASSEAKSTFVLAKEKI